MSLQVHVLFLKKQVEYLADQYCLPSALLMKNLRIREGILFQRSDFYTPLAYIAAIGLNKIAATGVNIE